MAVREFDGIDDVVQFDTGTVLSTMDGGPITIAAIVEVFDGFTGGDILFVNDLLFTAPEIFRLRTLGGNYTYATEVGSQDVAAVTTSVWCLAAVTKANGSVVPRGHHYNYNTATWSHANAAGALGDATYTAGGTGFVFVGGVFNFINARLAVVGAWNSALADVTLEGLTADLQSWVNASPSALWAFNQAVTTDPVLDLTGNGANQNTLTGTTVVVGDDPPGFNFTLGGGYVAPKLLIAPAPAVTRAATW